MVIPSVHSPNKKFEVFAVGDEVIISELAQARGIWRKRDPGRKGRVSKMVPGGDTIYVLWEGRKSPECVYYRYVKKILG